MFLKVVQLNGLPSHHKILETVSKIVRRCFYIPLMSKRSIQHLSLREFVFPLMTAVSRIKITYI